VTTLALIGVLSASVVAVEAAPPAAAETATARPVFAVVPGGAASPLAAGPKSGPPRLVWTGFQVTDEGSRVFVQTTGQVELEVSGASDKGGVTVTLRNCRIHMRNNSRTLDTRFFASPVQQIAVHQRHRDVKLEIALRQAVKATPRQEDGPDGTHFWVIDFAPAEAVASATPAKPGSLK
jgi:hypothetical protein